MCVCTHHTSAQRRRTPVVVVFLSRGGSGIFGFTVFWLRNCVCVRLAAKITHLVPRFRSVPGSFVIVDIRKQIHTHTHKQIGVHVVFFPLPNAAIRFQYAGLLTTRIFVCARCDVWCGAMANTYAGVAAVRCTHTHPASSWSSAADDTATNALEHSSLPIRLPTPRGAGTTLHSIRWQFSCIFHPVIQ